MKIDPSSEIFICNDDFKDNLLANLYSTVDYLKRELEEKNATINKLILHAENLCLRFSTENYTEPKLVETSSKIHSKDILVCNIDKNTQEERDFNGDGRFYKDNVDFKIINKRNSTNQHSTNTNQGNFNIPLQNKFNSLYVDNCVIVDDDSNKSNDDSSPVSNQHFSDNKAHIANKSRIYVNNHPERNILPPRKAENNNNDIVSMPISPTIKKQRQIVLLSASITKPIDMGEFNDLIINGNSLKRAHGGATASQLNYYVQATLNEDKPDTIIINAGTNNFSKKKKQTPKETCTEILEIVETCRRGGVLKIFVSSITCRPIYQEKIDEVNELLKYYAGIYNYEFIDNSGIRKEHLKNDGVHLLKSGICILANNFLRHINRASLLPFKSIWD